MSGTPSRDHYSYSVYADPSTAKNFDRRRFGGPIGQMVADSQAEAVARFAGPIHDRTILDVGTGTGRAAILLARAGGQVTGVDPSEEMLAIARLQASDASLSIRFDIGDAHRLQFADRVFDVVVCLRVLMHAADWEGCLAELCRVSSRAVIIDYPSARSAAFLESIGRRLVHRFGARTEPYRVFRDATVARALEKAGFRIRAEHRQFVLPIALHKAIGSARFSSRTRALSERLGLLRVFGSPVTVVAERW
ncbi:MAG: methyltransferase domain-containing protein [Acidobacteriota bacterium]